MATQKYYYGLLAILLISTAVYISFAGEVRLRIDDDKAVFYVNESRWLISALQLIGFIELIGMAGFIMIQIYV